MSWTVVSAAHDISSLSSLLLLLLLPLLLLISLVNPSSMIVPLFPNLNTGPNIWPLSSLTLVTGNADDICSVAPIAAVTIRNAIVRDSFIILATVVRHISDDRRS